MKKCDSLLKQAEVYEKLALYGDRKAFLRALAQAGAPVKLNETIRQGINSAMRDLGSSKPDDPKAKDLVNKLMGYVDMGTADRAFTTDELNKLYQLLVDASNTIPGNLTTQVQRILDLSHTVQQLTSSPAAAEPAGSSEEIRMPTDRITAYAPIPKDVQEHLSNLVTMRQWGIPLAKNDGKIGPETKSALDTFKKKMQLPPNTPNAQVFSVIEKEYAKDNPTTINLDEAAKAREEYWKEQSTPPGMGPRKT